MRLNVGALQVGPCYFYNSTGTDRQSILHAAWHSRRSVTWRWALSFHRYRARSYRHNCGGVLAITIPFAGSITLAWQRPIWRKP